MRSHHVLAAGLAVAWAFGAVHAADVRYVDCEKGRDGQEAALPRFAADRKGAVTATLSVWDDKLLRVVEHPQPVHEWRTLP